MESETSTKPTRKKRRSKNDICEIQKRWISGEIKEAKRDSRNPNFVRLTEDEVPVALGCKICKKVFTLIIGTAQRNHTCSDPLSHLYSSAAFNGFKKAFTTMSIQDFTPFSTTDHPGFQNAILFAMKIGMELPPEAKNLLNIDIISSIIPSPETISRSVEKRVADIQHFYAYLQKNAESTKFDISVDSTSSSFHYTSYNISFIDDDWKLKSYVLDIQADENRDEQGAVGARERTKRVIESCGLTEKSISCVVTDEATTMTAAFGDNRFDDDVEHAVCGCHLCSTVSKRTFDPYVSVTRSNPVLCRNLKPVQDIQKDAQLVANANILRLNIYLHMQE